MFLAALFTTASPKQEMMPMFINIKMINWHIHTSTTEQWKEWTSATHSNKDTTSWSSKTSKLTWGDRWKQWLLGGCGCWLEEMPMRTPSRVTEMFSNFQWSHRGEPSCTYVCKSHAATKLRKRKNLWTKALKICQQLVLQPWDNKVNFIKLSLSLCCNIKKNFF